MSANESTIRTIIKQASEIDPTFLSTIANLALSIKDLYDQATANEETARRLQERAKLLENLIEQWKGVNEGRLKADQLPTKGELYALEDCLRRLKKCLDNAYKKRSRIKYIIYSLTSKTPTEMVTIGRELDDKLEVLNTATVIETLGIIREVKDNVVEIKEMTEKIDKAMEMFMAKQDHNSLNDRWEAREKLRERITEATKVEDLVRVYQSKEFVTLMDDVEDAQLKHGSQWAWCQSWAQARRERKEWAAAYDDMRSTAMRLLKKLYDLYKDDFDNPDGPSAETKAAVFDTFGTKKIARVMSAFLPMDKANAFYNMTVKGKDGKKRVGLHWYCSEYDEERREQFVPKNAETGALSRKYIRLIRYGNEYLEENGKLPMGGEDVSHMLESYLVPQSHPRFRRSARTKLILLVFLLRRAKKDPFVSAKLEI